MCKQSSLGNCDPGTADQEYCIFHKPNKNKEEAIEFYRKFLERFKPRIEDIKVDGKKIKRLVFDSEINCIEFVFPRIPKIPIPYSDENGNRWNKAFSFQNSLFLGPVTFLRGIFDSSINFENVEFRDKVNFNGVRFEDDVVFSRSKFDKIATFEGAIFQEKAIFDGCYAEKCDFSHATFDAAIFDNSVINNGKFNGSTFNQEASFRNLTSSKLQFKPSKFIKSCDFSFSKFGELYLDSSRFKSLKLTKSRIDKKAEFKWMRVYGTFDFSFSRGKYLDLRYASVKEIIAKKGEFCYIDLSKVNHSKACRGYKASFEGAMIHSGHFDNITFESLIFESSRVLKTTFRNMTIKNANFKESQLINIDFSGAYIVNSTFEYAELRDTMFFNDAISSDIFTSSNANFVEVKAYNVDFRNINVTTANFSHARLINCDFSGAIIKKAKFISTKFKNNTFRRTTFYDVFFINSEFDKIDFSTVNFLYNLIFDGILIDKYLMLIKISQKNELNPEYLINSLYTPNCEKTRLRFCSPQSLSEAAKIQRIMYERIGDREKADVMFVVEMRAKRKLRMLQARENLSNAKGFKNKLKATINYIGTWIGVQAEKVLADWITEYGTNWRRILTASGAVIGIMGFVYWILSRFSEKVLLGIPVGTIYTCKHCATGGFSGLLNALYYSLVTFTTLGYGDMHPTGWLKALSATEALTGAVFMALIVAVIARKWMR